MCIRVRYVSTPCSPYDAEQQLINIPAHFEGPYAVAAARKVLTELHISQPSEGAVCWCGEPVRFLAFVPQQRETGDKQVIRHGA